MTFVNKRNGILVKIDDKGKESLVTKFRSKDFKKNGDNIAKSMNEMAKVSKEAKKNATKGLPEVQGSYDMDRIGYKSKYV